MCSPYIRKEANRLHWIVKGHLIPLNESDSTVEKIYDSYLTRIWGNNEAYVHEDGFSDAWEARYDTDPDISHVAVLGYD